MTDEPEKKLLAAVVETAVKDLKEAGGRDLATAWDYVFRSRRFKSHLNYLGIDVTAFREKANEILEGRSVDYDELEFSQKRIGWITLKHRIGELVVRSMLLQRKLTTARNELRTLKATHSEASTKA